MSGARGWVRGTERVLLRARWCALRLCALRIVPRGGGREGPIPPTIASCSAAPGSLLRICADRIVLRVSGADLGMLLLVSAAALAAPPTRAEGRPLEGPPSLSRGIDAAPPAPAGGEGPPGAARTAASGSESVPAATAPSPTPAPTAGKALFTDATAGSGIKFKNLCGAPPRQKRWLSEAMGSGAAWLDYDGDGRLDLYLVNGSAHDRPPGKGEPNRLFRGDGHGKFVDVTEAAGVGDRGWGQGVAIGDIDNDADPDIYVANLGRDVMYRNDGNGKFTDITQKAGVADGSWSSSAAFFDMEGDGDLDLYVCNYVDFDTRRVPARGTKEAERVTCILRGIPVFCGPLGLTPAQDVLYKNNGDGTFTDVTRASGVWLDEPRYALGVVTLDYDNDGDQDIYVANDSVPNSLWRNRGDGTFEDVGMTTLTALSGEGMSQAGMGTDAGDYDRDGWLDLVVTNYSNDLNTVYHNNGGMFFTDESLALGMGPTYMMLSWGVGFYDFDDDADLDLFIANGHVYPQVDDFSIGTTFRQINHLFLNNGERFDLAPTVAGLGAVASFRGAAFGDYDDDGAVDLLVTALDDPVLLLHNEVRPRGHFLEVRLAGGAGGGRPSAAASGSSAEQKDGGSAGRGSTDRPTPSAAASAQGPSTRFSNRDGVGARVTITAGGKRQMRERKGGGSYLSSSDPRLHFGLGAATRVDLIEVRWPSGRTEVFRDVPADTIVTLREGTGS